LEGTDSQKSGQTKGKPKGNSEGGCRPERIVGGIILEEGKKARAETGQTAPPDGGNAGGEMEKAEWKVGADWVGSGS